MLPAFQVQSVGHASSVDFSFGGRGPCDVDQQHIRCGIGMSRSVGPGTKDAHMHVYSTHSTLNVSEIATSSGIASLSAFSFLH